MQRQAMKCWGPSRGGERRWDKAAGLLLVLVAYAARREHTRGQTGPRRGQPLTAAGMDEIVTGGRTEPHWRDWTVTNSTIRP
jgi:hypothetical protein